MPERAGPQFISESGNPSGLTRFDAPYSFFIVVMNHRKDFPGGEEDVERSVQHRSGDGGSILLEFGPQHEFSVHDPTRTGPQFRPSARGCLRVQHHHQCVPDVL